jgi:hypothetical protein
VWWFCLALVGIFVCKLCIINIQFISWLRQVLRLLCGGLTLATLNPFKGKVCISNSYGLHFDIFLFGYIWYVGSILHHFPNHSMKLSLGFMSTKMNMWTLKIYMKREIYLHPFPLWHATPLLEQVVVTLVSMLLLETIVALESYMWLWLLEDYVNILSCALSFWMLKHFPPPFPPPN